MLFFRYFSAFCHLDMNIGEIKISHKRNSVAWTWEQKISDDDQKIYFSNAKTQSFYFEIKINAVLM